MEHKDIHWKDVMPTPIQSEETASDWQKQAEFMFGGGAVQPLPPYELTARERDALRSDARTWVDPMRFTVYKNAVIRYVSTHRSGFDYPFCYGLYDNPKSVLEAVLNSEEYRKYLGWNAKMPNNHDLVNLAIHQGTYEFSHSDYVKSQCERAIAYYHETNGVNKP